MLEMPQERIDVMTDAERKAIFLDERVKYMTIGRFKAKIKAMQRCEFESFKHLDDVYQVEEEAVLVPYEMYLRIQQALAQEAKQ
jgi:hypothetical protein